MKNLKIEASVENLSHVLAFVDEQLEAWDCPMKAQMQIDIAVEELFVNVASYAYAPETGDVEIQIDIGGTPPAAAITLIDGGRPYDPLKKEDPDTSLSAEEREIGGLGIYMVKKSMDDVRYEYKDDKNRLTIVKTLL